MGASVLLKPLRKVLKDVGTVAKTIFLEYGLCNSRDRYHVLFNAIHGPCNIFLVAIAVTITFPCLAIFLVLVLVLTLVFAISRNCGLGNGRGVVLGLVLGLVLTLGRVWQVGAGGTLGPFLAPWSWRYPDSCPFHRPCLHAPQTEQSVPDVPYQKLNCLFFFRGPWIKVDDV